MSCLSWNCRGLGNPEAVRELRSIVKLEGPTLLFVMETKINAKRVEDLKYTLGFGGCFAVDSAGLSGGRCLSKAHEAQQHVEVARSNSKPANWDVLIKVAPMALSTWTGDRRKRSQVTL